MHDTPFTAIDHVQLAMPAGEEDTARKFFRDLLGMVEIPKPAELAQRGGCWFQSGAVQIHIGVDKDFHSATKAHPALRCRNYAKLLARLHQAGITVRDAIELPGQPAVTFSIPGATGSSLLPTSSDDSYLR